MGSNDQSTVSFDDLLRSINSEHTTPEKHDDFELFSQSQTETLSFEPELVEHQNQHTPDSVDSFFPAPNQSDSSFEMLSGPIVALEPPTPHEDGFRTPNISVSARALSRLQTNFEFTPASNPYYDSYHLLEPPSGGGFASSPLSCQPSLLGSPSQPNESTFVSPLCYGAPIARRQLRHQRDLSGASSLDSSNSSQYFDAFQAIDPSALAPPLIPAPTTPIISPFINQTVEHGPDGSATGRYQRPLTSTGRPSHARKTPPGHVKRPRNAFILFRSHACAANLIPPTVEKDHRQISRIVSHMWRDLPASERVRWEREAEQEKELHRRLHPDYRYKPIYRKEGSAKKKPQTGRRKPGKTPISGTSPPSTADDDERPSIQREHEREEALRCEVVARVVMETKLSGIAIEEGQMEARVSEEIRNVRRRDAQGGEEKFIPPPLQPRRKSRANSAPPPPSPLRTMHVHDIVYNPKSRGSRELSPDFPKHRTNDVTAFDGMDDVPTPAWSMPGFAPYGDFHPVYDFTSLGDLNRYENGPVSSFFGENQPEFDAFQQPLHTFSPRQSSMLLGDFSLVPAETSSPTWPQGEERSDESMPDFTLALPADTHALEQFQHPFEKSASEVHQGPYAFFTHDQTCSDGISEHIIPSGY